MDIDLVCSRNGVDWETFHLKTEVQIPIGTSLFLKSNGTRTFSTKEKKCRFHMDGEISACGSIQWLIDPEGKRTDVPDYCFCELFKKCNSLISAPELPATELGENCYDSMFLECKNLTSSPKLPAENLAYGCYNKMFSICENLEYAGEILAKDVNENCCFQMFSDCKKLSTMPIPHAESLGVKCCQGMFQKCYNLKIHETYAEGRTKWLMPANVTVESDDWSEKMFDGTGGSYKNSPVLGVEYWIGE